MATTKTIQPTGTTITIPAMTDRPDASVFSTDVDRITDATNALNSNIKTTGMFKTINATYTTSATGNANIMQLASDNVIVAVRPPAGIAFAFVGRGNNGAYYVHITDSSGNPITNTSVTLDIYYV